MLQQFLLAEWQSILTGVLFVVACIVLIKRGYGYYVSEMLFYLVSEAETRFGAGTGELKYAAVTTWIYEKLPTLAKILFTRKQIDKLIEQAVDRLKKYLEENKAAENLILPIKRTQMNL